MSTRSNQLQRGHVLCSPHLINNKALNGQWSVRKTSLRLQSSIFRCLVVCGIFNNNKKKVTSALLALDNTGEIYSYLNFVEEIHHSDSGGVHQDVKVEIRGKIYVVLPLILRFVPHELFFFLKLEKLGTERKFFWNSKTKP